MLNICITLILLTTTNSKEIQNCYKKKGAMVIEIKVMLDEGAVLGLSATNPKGYRHFFYNIFDPLNQFLQPYGAQFQLDFSMTSTAPFIYDKTKCLEPNPAQSRASIAMNTLKGSGKIGNRLIVFFCPNNINSKLTGSLAQGNCNNVLGFLAGNPKMLAEVIKKNVMDQIFKTSDRSGYFNDKICELSKKCENDASWKYVPDLKAVRHVGNDRFVLNNGDELAEHDLYDDMFLHNYIGKN